MDSSKSQSQPSIEMNEAPQVPYNHNLNPYEVESLGVTSNGLDGGNNMSGLGVDNLNPMNPLNPMLQFQQIYRAAAQTQNLNNINSEENFMYNPNRNANANGNGNAFQGNMNLNQNQINLDQTNPNSLSVSYRNNHNNNLNLNPNHSHSHTSPMMAVMGYGHNPNANNHIVHNENNFSGLLKDSNNSDQIDVLSSLLVQNQQNGNINNSHPNTHNHNLAHMNSNFYGLQSGPLQVSSNSSHLNINNLHNLNRPGPGFPGPTGPGSNFNNPQGGSLYTPHTHNHNNNHNHNHMNQTSFTQWNLYGPDANANRNNINLFHNSNNNNSNIMHIRRSSGGVGGLKTNGSGSLSLLSQGQGQEPSGSGQGQVTVSALASASASGSSGPSGVSDEEQKNNISQSNHLNIHDDANNNNETIQGEAQTPYISPITSPSSNLTNINNTISFNDPSTGGSSNSLLSLSTLSPALTESFNGLTFQENVRSPLSLSVNGASHNPNPSNPQMGLGMLPWENNMNLPSNQINFRYTSRQSPSAALSNNFSNNLLNFNSHNSLAGQPTHGTTLNNNISLLNNTNMSNANTLNPFSSLTLVDIASRGLLLELAVDQYGSRFIQQRLESTASVEEKEAAFIALLPETLRLSTDVFGNYVVQKLLDHGLPNHQNSIAQALLGHVFLLSLQMYGCRVVQKALDVCDLDTMTSIVRELAPNVMQCVRDQNANHVLQKAVSKFSLVPQQLIHFIVDTFVNEPGQVRQLCLHPYGCRVIQRLLEHVSDEEHRHLLVSEVIAHADELSRNSYGNYVVQHLLVHGSSWTHTAVVRSLKGKVATMAKHKFASNVVEKAFTHASKQDRAALLEEIVGSLKSFQNNDINNSNNNSNTLNNNQPPGPLSIDSNNNNDSTNSKSVTPNNINDSNSNGNGEKENVNVINGNTLLLLVKDQYGNYVVQKMLDVLEEDERQLVVARLKKHFTQLKKIPYGKHILARLDKLQSASNNNNHMGHSFRSESIPIANSNNPTFAASAAPAMARTIENSNGNKIEAGIAATASSTLVNPTPSINGAGAGHDPSDTLSVSTESNQL